MSISAINASSTTVLRHGRCPGHDWVAAVGLDFDQLSWEHFERLCCALLPLEGYENVQRLAGGVEQCGLDLIAERAGERVGFQCRRVKRFGQGDFDEIVRKFLRCSWSRRPARLVLLITKDLGVGIHDAFDRHRAAVNCEAWAGTALGDRIKSHPALLRQYFGLAAAPAPFLASPDRARREQQSQATALSLAVENSVLGIPFLFIPSGCVEMQPRGRSLATGSPFYLAQRPLSRAQWVAVSGEVVAGDGAAMPQSGLSVERIRSFLDGANGRLAGERAEWRLDLPTDVEVQYAMVAGGDLAGVRSSLGFDDFFGDTFQCCRSQPGSPFPWVLVGGSLDVEPGPLPIDRSLPIHNTAGARREMGFRPALRRSSPLTAVDEDTRP